MVELSIQQQQMILKYRKSHPESAKISDTQILSIMSKDANIQLNNEEQNSIFAGKTKTTKTNNFTLNTDKTIELPSGKKIAIKDGKTHYYSENGVELNQNDFEKTEGKIEIKPSGRYSVTKNGTTKYYALDGTEIKESYFKQIENSDVKIISKDGKTYNFNKTLEKRIDLVSSKIEQAEEENGYIGKAWSGFKNLTGIGAGSDDVREIQKEEQKLLAQFNSNPQTRSATFKKLTGVEYSQENLEKFIKGEIKLKSEQALDDYKEGQEEAVDVTSDIASGLASYGAAAVAIGAGIAAAPFTAGASLGGVAVGIGIAAGTGAATKAVIKASDAAVGGRECTLKDTTKDLIVGGVGGSLAPITMGVGGAISNATVKTGGKVIAKTIGKEALEKATTQKVLTEVAFVTSTSTEGAIWGGADNGTRAAVNGSTLEETLDAAAEGAVGGAILGPLMGYSAKGAGKALKSAKNSLNKIESPWDTKEINNIIENIGAKNLEQKDKDAIRQIYKDLKQHKSELQNRGTSSHEINNIIKFLKANNDYTQKDVERILSFIQKTGYDYQAVRVFSQLDSAASHFPHSEFLEMLKGFENLSSEQVEKIIAGNSNLSRSLFDFTDFAFRWDFDEKAVKLFTSMIGEANSMRPETLSWIERIAKVDGHSGIDRLSQKEVQEIHKFLSTLTKEEKEAFKRCNVDIDNLLERVNPATTGFEVVTSKAKQNRFLSSVIANNNSTAENVLKGNDLKKYLQNLEDNNEALPLKYTRQSFCTDLKNLLQKLPEAEQEKVLKHLNIKMNETSFNGFVKVDEFKMNEFSKNSESTLKEIKNIVDKFALNNEVNVQNTEIKQVLDDLVQGFPEFTSIIGKIDADHAGSLEVHTLKVLSKAMSDPNYANLSNSEKTMLKFAVLLHDIGKAEGINTPHAEKSALYARSILDKINMSSDMKDGIVNLIKNHHWTQAPKVFYHQFRTPEQEKVAMILGNADKNARFNTNTETTPTGNKLKNIYSREELEITQNSFVATKYPKQNFTLSNGKTVSVKVADLRNVNYDAPASDYGWFSNENLGNTKIQVHNVKTDNIGTAAEKLREIIKASLNPNKEMVLSTSVTNIPQMQANGYGNVTAILKTPNGNLSHFKQGSGSGLKKDISYFYGSADQNKNILIDKNDNEILALKPQIEQIGLTNIEPENIPLDLIELAAEYDIPIVIFR